MHSRVEDHETLRDRGQLVLLDKLEEARDGYSAAGTRGARAVVFFSHQWLAFDAPDPERLQFDTMRRALAALQAGDAKGAELYVWADFCSIPQRQRRIKTLAIASLPAFAGAADYFVAVVPDATHADTRARCDRDSYLRRAWRSGNQPASWTCPAKLQNSPSPSNRSRFG